MKIQELALKATESMISNGYKPITAWYTYENVLKNVVIEHERQNTDEYSEKAVSTYAEAVNRRYRNKEISYSHYRFLMHALRRSLGRDMLLAGNSVEQIAQVLGHRDIDSTKQYLSIDTEGLRKCALDFSGIEVSK